MLLAEFVDDGPICIFMAAQWFFPYGSGSLVAPLGAKISTARRSGLEPNGYVVEPLSA